MNNNYNTLGKSNLISTKNPIRSSEKINVDKKPLEGIKYRRGKHVLKKNPAFFYLWSKSSRLRHKPLRLNHFPHNDLPKIRFGAFVGRQDERCISCPFHGAKHGCTLHPTVFCICKYKSLVPSPVKVDITRYLVATGRTVVGDQEKLWRSYDKHIDMIINSAYLGFCRNMV